MFEVIGRVGLLAIPLSFFGVTLGRPALGFLGWAARQVGSKMLESGVDFVVAEVASLRLESSDEWWDDLLYLGNRFAP